MNKVLETTWEVVKRSRSVSINRDEVGFFSSDIEVEDIKTWETANILPKPHKELDDKEKVQLIFTANALNFCYWQEPRWNIEYGGKKFKGSLALWASFNRALDENIPILDAFYLEHLEERDFLNVTRGENKIPLLGQRVEILREIGRVLRERYGGKFAQVINKSGGSALSLVDLLTSHFPSYRDQAKYQGLPVFFNKRAQLATSDLYQTFNGESWGNLSGINSLTAFADYKIPAVLRDLGIIGYRGELADRIDSKQEIPAGSKEEIEIRANQIWAVEYIRRELQPRMPGINAVKIDNWLWIKGQSRPLESRHPHRTVTTAY
ncbi:MAG: queuosine salvage family protein [Nanoarchaeota archaeon]|nr:queuosine salvage family protein [Nanoarchaeota archaeon]